MSQDNLSIELQVNGDRYELEVRSHHTLLDVLRSQLDLTGTKECCSEGECGACTVIVDERAINSCLMLAVEADGSEITTVEGLGEEGRLSPVQDAFIGQGAVQCGFCIPGMVMSAEYLLDRVPDPSLDEVKEGLSGNLCRCAGYKRIFEAVLTAAEERSRAS